LLQPQASSLKPSHDRSASPFDHHFDAFAGFTGGAGVKRELALVEMQSGQSDQAIKDFTVATTAPPAGTAGAIVVSSHGSISGVVLDGSPVPHVVVEPEAHLAKNLLESEQIPTFLSEEIAGDMLHLGNEIKLMVAAEHAAAQTTTTTTSTLAPPPTRPTRPTRPTQPTRPCRPMPSPATMSTSPDSRLACSAAVFSISLMMMRLNPGLVPDQCGFGSKTSCAPDW
jgi:hypothetical protein